MKTCINGESYTETVKLKASFASPQLFFFSLLNLQV